MSPLDVGVYAEVDQVVCPTCHVGTTAHLKFDHVMYVGCGHRLTLAQLQAWHVLTDPS